MTPTKLDVFKLQFDVNTPQFLKEAAENCRGGLYPTCWNMFSNLLRMVSQRAAELNDPILNVLMLRLNLYDLNDGTTGSNISKDTARRTALIKQIEEHVKNEAQ